MNEPNYSLALIAAPAAEPLTIEEVYAQSRIPEEEDEDLVGSYITAARQYFEDHDSRRLCSQTWLLTLDRFPCGGYGYYNQIEIPLRPVQVVNSVKYIDLEGVQQTIDPALYDVDLKSFLARIRPAYNTIWPVARCVMNAVEIEFVCGYGDAVATPGAGFDGTNYFLTLTPSWATNATPSLKTSAGFHVAFDAAAPVSATLDVLVQAGSPLQTLARKVFSITAAAMSADLTFDNTLPTPSSIVGGIPQHLKQALLLHIGHLYENREDTIAGVTMMSIPMGYDALVGANRRLHV